MLGPPSAGSRFRFVLVGFTSFFLPAAAGCNLEQGGLAGGEPVLQSDAAVRRPSYPPPPPMTPPPPVTETDPAPAAVDAAPAAPDAGAAPTQPPVDASLPPDAGAGAQPPPAPPLSTPPTPADFCNGNQLLVCLPFDGTAEDLGPARRAMNISGVTFEPGRRGQAARFGPGRQVEVRDSFPVFERIISVELAVQPTSHPPGGRRAGLVHSPDQYGLFLLGNDGDVECRTPAANAIARRAAPPGTWTRILCIFDEEDVELYINGRSVADGRSFQRLALRGSGGTLIGDTDFDGTDLEGAPLSGLIDDLRIWRGRRNP
jgi:hypothetical protein